MELRGKRPQVLCFNPWDKCPPKTSIQQINPKIQISGERYPDQIRNYQIASLTIFYGNQGGVIPFICRDDPVKNSYVERSGGHLSLKSIARNKFGAKCPKLQREYYVREHMARI